MLQDRSTTQTPCHPDGEWPGILDEYGVQFLALDIDSDSELVKLFRSLPGWTVSFEDKEAVLFVRADIAQAYTNRAGTHNDAWVVT